MKNTSMSLATIKCLAFNKETGEKFSINKLDIVVGSREDLAKPLPQAKLLKMREIGNRTDEWMVYGRCSCSGYANMLAVKKPNQEAFTLRDTHVGQHASTCALYKPIVHTNSDGKKIGLKPSMFEMPSKKEGLEKSKKSKAVTTAVVDGNTYETVSGMLATTFDLSCHLANDRFPDFNWSSFEKTQFKQIMDLPHLGKTFREGKEDAKKVGKMISVVIKKLKELKVTSYDGSEVFELNDNLKTRLERCSGSLFRIVGVDGYIRGDILLSAIKGLKIFKRYVTGPYVMVAIKVKEKGEFYETPILHFQPVYIGVKCILPVESSLERACVSVSGDFNDIKLFKPTSRQKDIFRSQLESFLEEVPLAKEEYFKSMKEYAKKEGVKQVRPDLFVLYRGQVLVFEIAGMMNDPKYVKGLMQKEKLFYSQLSIIKYHRVESVQEMQAVMEQY